MEDDEIPSVVWYVLGALLSIVLVAGVTNVMSRMQKRNAERAHCVDAQTICVVLYSRLDNYACAGTMKNLLDAATCPRRVRFFIHQCVESGKSRDVIDLYEELSMSMYDDHPRLDPVVTTSRDDRHPSFANAVHRLCTTAAQRHPDAYLLITQPGTIFATGFDRILRQQWTPKRPVLTCIGPKFTTKSHRSTARTPAAYYANTFPSSPPALDPCPWFPVLRSHDAVEAMRSAAYDQSLPALLCSATCTFFRARPPLRGRDIECPNDDLALTHLLFENKFTEYATPPATVCFQRSTPPKKTTHTTCHLTAPFLHRMGMDEDRRIYGQGYLGLSVDYTETEIKDKYGSRTQMERVRSTQTA